MLAAADVVVRCTPFGEQPVAVEAGGDLVEVVTKSDLAGSVSAVPAGKPVAVQTDAPLAISGATGSGLAELRATVAARIRRDRALRQARLATILPRHDAAFGAAAAALEETARRARDSRDVGRLADVELVASLLRSALDALGEVAGPMHPDDVLGLVFSRFCIGK
jgi:tRNA modification GTPase